MVWVLLLCLLLPVSAWATAPTFVQEAEITDWMATGEPKTTGSFTVQSGDILVLICGNEDQKAATDCSVTPTNTGTAFTWTLRQNNTTTNYTDVAIYTAVASTGQSMTVSMDLTGADAGSIRWGFNVFTFRGSDGVGNSSLTNVTNGAPSLSLTTTQADSAIVMINGDWAAVDGASATYRTSDAGTFTQQTYARNSSAYTVYGGYYANAGSAAAKTVGISAPGAQTYAIAAIEIKGTAGGGAAETFGFRLRRPE